MSIVREFINLIGWDVDQAAFQAAENQVQSVLDKMENFGRKATLLFTLPFVAASAAAIKFASDATETQNRFNAVFRDMQGEANIWAETYADSLDRGDIATKKSLSIFQSLFVGLNANSDKAFEFSKRIVAAADDLSSFADKSPLEIQDRFISAMTGSTESVDQFGINLKAAALDAKALELGLGKTSKQMSELEKATLRLQIIEDTLGRQGATGDALKTMHDFANRLRSAKDMAIQTAISFGNILLPAATKLLDVFIKLNKWITTKITPEMKTIIIVTSALLAVIGPLVLAFTTLVKIGLFVQSTFAAFSAAATVAGGTIGILLIKFVAIAAVVLAVVAAFALLAEDIFQFVKGNESFIGQFLEPWETLQPKIMAILRPLITALREGWEAAKFILQEVVTFIRASWANDLQGATKAVERIFERLGPAISNIMAAMAPLLVDAMVIWGTVLIKHIPMIIAKIALAFITAWGAMWGAIFNITADMAQKVADSIGDVIADTAKSIFGFSKNITSDVNANIRGSVEDNRNNIGRQLQQGGASNSNSTVNNQNTFNLPLTVNIPEGTPEQQQQALTGNVQDVVKNTFEGHINELSFNSAVVQ